MTAEAPYRFLRYEERGPVALVTLDRPEARNALSVRLYFELVAAFEAANANDAIGAIVLTSTGPVFCAGADFKESREDPVRDERGRPMGVGGLGMRQDASWIHLLQRSKPSIVAVQGAAIGLGVTSILAADIRMAAQSASFSFPFVKLGTLPEFGATALLPKLVGLGNALDLCMSAARIDAEEARRIGLVSRVVADDRLIDEALTLGTAIAGFPKQRVLTTRELILANADERDVNAYLKRESLAFVALFKEGAGRPSRPERAT